jgi:hypothetical protein
MGVTELAVPAAFLVATFLLDTALFLSPFLVDVGFEVFFFDAPFAETRFGGAAFRRTFAFFDAAFLRELCTIDLRDLAVAVFFLSTDFLLLLAAAFPVGMRFASKTT